MFLFEDDSEGPGHKKRSWLVARYRLKPMLLCSPDWRAGICAVFLFQFSYSNLRHSNHRIGGHTCTNQTVPYGTALLGGAVPGTSCQATIAPSLRDAFSLAPLGHNPKSLSAFVERSDLLILTKS